MIKPNKGIIEIIRPEIPDEIKEIIRQYGVMIETYKHIVEVWAYPPILYRSMPSVPKMEVKE